MPEVVPQGIVGNLAQRAGQLDACRSPADNDERQPGVALLRIRLPLGAFECQQEAAADGRRIPMVFRPGATAAQLSLPK